MSPFLPFGKGVGATFLPAPSFFLTSVVCATSSNPPSSWLDMGLRPSSSSSWSSAWRLPFLRRAPSYFLFDRSVPSSSSPSSSSRSSGFLRFLRKYQTLPMIAMLTMRVAPTETPIRRPGEELSCWTVLMLELPENTSGGTGYAGGC